MLQTNKQTERQTEGTERLIHADRHGAGNKDITKMKVSISVP